MQSFSSYTMTLEIEGDLLVIISPERRPYILAVLLVTLMPFVNYYIADAIWGMPANDSIALIWARGLGILLVVLTALALLGAIPIIGPIFLVLIGRPLGFPDFDAENALKSLFNKTKPPSPNAPDTNNKTTSNIEIQQK